MATSAQVAAHCRGVFKHAVERNGEIDYTMGSQRWSGIAGRHDYPSLPPHADCSAFTTWVVWTSRRAVRGSAGVDVINGEKWLEGYTVTQIQHGKQHSQKHPGLWVPGRTLVFYCGPPDGLDPSPVVMWLGNLVWNRKLGSIDWLRSRGIECVKDERGIWRLRNVVGSHGRDAGPELWPWNYRPPVQARLYAI